MNTKPQPPVQELDHRTNDGIEVSLLWNSRTGRVSVAVEDARRDESFEFEVAPSQALPAFFHPYAHAGLACARGAGEPNRPNPHTI